MLSTSSAFTVRLTFGLTFTLAGGLAVGMAGGLMSEPAVGLASELLFGLGVGLTGGSAFGLTAAAKHTDLQLRGRVRELLGSLWVGLAGGLAIGLAGGLAVGLAEGLAIGLAVGLAGGLMSFTASPSIAQRASSPADSQRGDRRHTVLAASTLGLAGMLAVGLAGGLAFGLKFLLAGGLALGLAGGLAMGLAFGLAGKAWPAFLVASGWLVIRRRFPWRLMAFLDDAYRLGLLRLVGSAYQFRHAELQNHLAP